MFYFVDGEVDLMAAALTAYLETAEGEERDRAAGLLVRVQAEQEKRRQLLAVDRQAERARMADRN